MKKTVLMLSVLVLFGFGLCYVLKDIAEHYASEMLKPDPVRSYVVVHRSGTDILVADSYQIGRGRLERGQLTLLRSGMTVKCYSDGTWYSIEREIKDESR